MKFSSKLILIVLALGLSACSSIVEEKIVEEKQEYIKFAEQKNYVKTYSTYVDEKLLAKPKKKDIWVKVNLQKQRIRLIVDGQTALDSPATTGKKDYDTPTGTFSIIEKTEDKESNLYGKFYKEDKLIYTGSEKEYLDKQIEEGNLEAKLEYDDYKGAPMPNWLRLTRDGVGIHQSKGIRRSPASHGCIRVPAKTSNILYSKLMQGSLVTVVGNDIPKDDKTKYQNIKPTKPIMPVSNENLPASERLRLLRESKIKKIEKTDKG